MKKLIIIACLFATFSAIAADPAEVNEKVLKAFKETFVKATDVVWHEMQNSYEAAFKQSNILIRASYDTEGNLLSTTRYYQEENLPVQILLKLKKGYEGKSVFGVTESTTQDNVTYYITLQDEKNWYVVKSDNWGSFETVKKFKKA